MRRALAAVGLAAIIVSGSSVLANAAGRTVTLVSVQIREKGGSNGLTIWDNDVQAGKRIGHDRLVCTFTPRRTASCKIAFVLAAGTLRGSTELAETQVSGTIRILGGTGAYRDATGSGTFKNLNSAGTRTRVVLHLR
jgi:hypothetical protein